MSNFQLKNFETLQSLCKRRGYVFQSAEVYGGLNACWDYGPLGVQLKRNLADLWWRTMVRRSDIVGLDSAILSHQEVLKASGHVSAFTDPLVDCLDCKYRFRLEDKKYALSAVLKKQRNPVLLISCLRPMQVLLRERGLWFISDRKQHKALRSVFEYSNVFQKSASLWGGTNRKSL